MGLALSAFLMVIALTGTALVWKEAWWRLIYPELSGPPPALNAAEQAAGITAIHNRFGDSVRVIKLPSEDLPAWHVRLSEGQAFIAPHTLDVIDSWDTRDRLMSFLFDLHHHLLLGETGKLITGYLGLGGTFMALTGLIIWWPQRKTFSVANLVPRGWSRIKLLRWHRDLGLLFTPLLLVLLLTGSGMIFYKTTMTVLNGLFGAPEASTVSTTITQPQTAPENGRLPLRSDDLARVGAVFPEGRIIRYSPPDPGGDGLHSFRLKQPCEIHPNGRSYVYLTATDGNIARTSDACTASGGQKAQNLLYPLHAGLIGNLFYKWLVFAGGLVLTILCASGVYTYAVRIARRK
jgi:uncharacterized iron-regulated membrane protein